MRHPVILTAMGLSALGIAAASAQNVTGFPAGGAVDPGAGYFIGPDGTIQGDGYEFGQVPLSQPAPAPVAPFAPAFPAEAPFAQPAPFQPAPLQSAPFQPAPVAPFGSPAQLGSIGADPFAPAGGDHFAPAGGDPFAPAGGDPFAHGLGGQTQGQHPEVHYEVSADGTISESAVFVGSTAPPSALPSPVFDSHAPNYDATAPIAGTLVPPYDLATPSAPFTDFGAAQHVTDGLGGGGAYDLAAPSYEVTAPASDVFASDAPFTDFAPSVLETTSPAPAYVDPIGHQAQETILTAEPRPNVFKRTLAGALDLFSSDSHSDAELLNDLPLETTSAGVAYDVSTSSFEYGAESFATPEFAAPEYIATDVTQHFEPAPVQAQVYANLSPEDDAPTGPIYDSPHGQFSGADFAARGDGAFGPARISISSQSAAAQPVVTAVGRSTVVTLPVEATEVVVTDPTVARVILRTARQSLIVGLRPGTADVSYFDDDGNLISSLDLSVSYDLEPLKATLARAFPHVDIRLDPLPGGELVVEGVATSPSEASAIRNLIQRYLVATATAAGVDVDSEGLAFIDRLTFASDDQVLLKVRLAEMRRSVVKQFGVDFSAASNSAVNSASTFGSVFETAGTISNGFPVNGGVLGGIAANIAGQFGGGDFGGLIQAFEQQNVVRLLAEPTLTATTGEQASFLAGGEFPFPSGIDENGNVSVSYRPFGVALEFTPVVLDGGRISITIATEVSELTSEGSIDIGGVTVPGIAVRRADTTVELPSGGTMSIGGLLLRRDDASHSGLPGLKNLPVLGQLFSSVDYENSETELVILVTPYLARPGIEKDFRLPTDGFAPASDFDLFLLGRIQKVFGSGASPNSAAARQALKSPFGFIVE